MLSCSYCQRNYQRKLYFDRHVITCQFLSQSKRERVIEREELADTPSVRELFSIIQMLAQKCNHLETKMDAIQKWAHITKQKLNITDWLNTTYPHSTDYDNWVNALKVDQTALAVLFETDYVEGVVRLLKQKLLVSDEGRPLRAFNGKENTFYIFRSQKWVLCDEETFKKLMYLFDKQFMGEFIAWQTINKNKVSSDDSFSEVYARNMKKVMGGNYSRDQLYLRIQKELYQYSRTNPPNIMEYETTFS